MSADPFLAQLARDNRLAQAMADVAREEGDHALAERLEHQQAERTIQTLLAHGYQL